MRPEVLDASPCGGFLKHPPHVGVGDWQSSDLHRAGKYPILLRRELGRLPPGFQHFDTFDGSQSLEMSIF